ncbi:MAG: HAD-IB family hydrolase [Candidatus Margulisiibacteriota bacterium]
MNQQSVANRIAVFDIDGTIIKGFTEFHFFIYLFKKGIINVADIISLAMYFILFRLGFMSVEGLRKKAAGIVDGMKIEKFSQIVKNFFNETIRHRISEKALKIIDADKRQEYRIVISTAAFDLIAQGYADIVSADSIIATEIAVCENVINGKVKSVINYGRNKEAKMREFCRNNNVDLAKSKAYANDLSDLFLLKMFGCPIVCNPDRKMRAIARKNGWRELKLI